MADRKKGSRNNRVEKISLSNLADAPELSELKEGMAQASIENERDERERVRSEKQAKRDAEIQRNRDEAVLKKDGFFHNPYNFIPIPSRETNHETLGDHSPKSHALFYQDAWSGRISVKMTTQTPLLMVDAANGVTKEDDQSRKEHTTFPIRAIKQPIQAGSNQLIEVPHVAPTAIKGMLRSAYEAVTNSRFGISENHSDRLAYRMAAQKGLSMVPARIDGDNVCLYTGTSTIRKDGKPDRAMYAAWLPRYCADKHDINDTGEVDKNRAVRYIEDNSPPQHGDLVNAVVELCQKQTRNGGFQYWKVREITKNDSVLSIPAELEPSRKKGQHSSLKSFQTIKQGYVFVSNRNIDTKHDERVFFCNGNIIKEPLTAELKQRWENLISDYQRTHAAELKDNATRPPALKKSKWSRHIKPDYVDKTLTSGSLCYALVKKVNGKYQIEDLYPAMISRGLYEKPPQELIPDQLRPAKTVEDLSSADRVFGWANQEGSGTYKGNLRIHSVTYDSSVNPNPIKKFPIPLSLPILGQPNPQQFRFYLADSNGKAISSTVRQERGYSGQQTIRGRKVYPHHQHLTRAEWTEPYTPEAHDYIHPGENSNQNRSISEWVEPDVTMKFEIDVTNLSMVELGGLLWLLSSSEQYDAVTCHRLGGGKPFGFGSVKLTVDPLLTDLKNGAQWQTFYSELRPPTLEAFNLETAIVAFQQAIETAYGNDVNSQEPQSFEEISFIKSFLRMSEGFDDQLPIHYPRTSDYHPSKQANEATREEGFTWFGKNLQRGNPRNGTPVGRKLALPLLSEDQGLPLEPTVSSPNSNQDKSVSTKNVAKPILRKNRKDNS
ncbi:MAG: TIGR03986 family CRISPR-associated RAMP protein [Bacteroidota bacterium]